MKEKEKAKYSIAQNVRFMIKAAMNKHKSVLVLCVSIAAVCVALNLTQLYVTPRILAKVEQEAPLTELLLTIAAFTALMFLLIGIRDYLTENRLPPEIDVRVSILQLISRKACETSYPNTLDPKVSKLKEQACNATNSNEEASEHIWRTLTAILTNIGSFVIYLFLLSDLNVFLASVVIVTTIISFFITGYANGWENRHRSEKESYEKELSYCIEKSRSLDFAKDVRIFGLAPWLHDIHSKSLRLYTAFIARRERKYILANIADIILTLLRNGLAYAYLINLTLKQNLPASEFLLYFTAISSFTTLVTGILSEFTVLHKESLSLSRIQEYLHVEEPFRFDDGILPPKADSYELRLDNVSFRYPGAKQSILEHVNLTIHPGEKLAIVGLNGAGKTTLVKLLCGFYDPDEGRVLLNGRDIREFNRKQYYELFSAVFQNFSILDTTIAQTVAQSVCDIDYDKVYDCLDKAGLTATVSKFPDGVETHIGREVYLDGVMLSGGQTQRLMLARALYKNGPLLILDEPTAALDPIAENDIYMKYCEMTANKTSVFISHRLASTRFCDRIIFVADGAITEEGTHDELLAKNGAYAKLFEVQSRYYREGGQSDEEEI